MGFGELAGSELERKRKQLARDTIIPCPDCRNKGLRKQLEADPARWLKYMFPTDFYLPWAPHHHEIIHAAIEAMYQGTSMGTAAPRASGKSTLLGDCALYGACCGATGFVLVLGWTYQAAQGMFRGWLSELSENEKLASLYPEICTPFRESIQPVRIRSLCKTPGEKYGADVRTTVNYLVLPTGVPLAAASMKGSTRGMRIKVAGRWARPDCVLLDDPQDESTARSSELCGKVIKKIDSDLMSLSGPDRRITVMAAVTVIETDDVAEQLLNRPDMTSIRCAQVTAWPDGWDDTQSECRKLLAEFDLLRCDSKKDDGKALRKFYRANKAALAKGMEVSWPERMDKKRGDPDATFSALYDFCRLGERAFMAERQNAPMATDATVYDLRPAMIKKAVYPGRQRGEVPESAKIAIVSTDINHYGLHSACVAMANDQTAALVWYGRHDNRRRGIVPKNTPEQQAKQLVFEALVKHGEDLARLRLTIGDKRANIGLWVIDAGYMGDVVRKYVEGIGLALPIQVMATRGFSDVAYRPAGKGTIGEPREGCHLAEAGITGRFLAFNADYWREVGQRAWLTSPGAPGGISLHEGQHTEFAEHICREKLLEKLDGKYGPVWKWTTQPGWHDWLDAVTMCYAACAWSGIGTQGAVPMRQAPRSRWKRKHVKV